MKRAATVVVTVALALASGCGPPDEACASSLGSRVEGPRMVREVIADTTLPLPTRVAAARSLLGSPRRDVYAPEVVGEAVRALAAEDGRALSEGLLPHIDAGLTGTSLRAGLRAKDLLVEIGPRLPAPLRTARLAAWFAPGPERFGGRHTALTVYRREGPEALRQMLDFSESPVLAPHLVALLHELRSDDAMRPLAIDRLLWSEENAHGQVLDDYLRQWLEQRLAEQGDEPDPMRVERALLLNRDNLRREAALALTPFVNEPRVRDRLMDRAAEMTLEAPVRRAALSVLGTTPRNDTEARRLLELGLDSTEPPAIREAAFASIESTEGIAGDAYEAIGPAPREARPHLLRLALAADPARIAARLLEDGLYEGPYDLRQLRAIGERAGAHLPEGLRMQLASGSDPHLVLIAVAAGEPTARFEEDRRPLQLDNGEALTLGDILNLRGTDGLVWRPTPAEHQRAERAQEQALERLEAAPPSFWSDLAQGPDRPDSVPQPVPSPRREPP